MKVRPQTLLGLLLLGFVTTSASAQDFYWNTASARSQALGGVYVPSSSDALDAIAANPAGPTSLSSRTLDMSLSSVFARGSFSNSVNNSAPMTTSPGVLPYGAFGMPISHSRFSFGVGIMPDLMSVSDWNYVDAPGTAGATYGMQEQKSAIMAVRMAGGLGASFGKRFSVGATVGTDYNTNTLHAPYIFQSEPTLQGLKTLLDLHTNGWGWNTSVGVLARPLNKVEVGVAWKSHTVIDSHGYANGDAYAQFAALGVPGPSDFHYSAEVRNVLPQSVLASLAWHANPRWVLAFQTNWVNWSNAFVNLPVTLTNGTNDTINTLAGSTTLVDGIPVNWKDQTSYHVGVEHLLTEKTSIRFGYAYGNNPVPSSTLTPMTAAIMSNRISTGFVFHPGRSRFEAAYSFDPTAQAQVQQSGLLAGEYNNSTVRVGTQALTLSYSFQF